MILYNRIQTCGFYFSFGSAVPQLVLKNYFGCLSTWIPQRITLVLAATLHKPDV